MTERGLPLAVIYAGLLAGNGCAWTWAIALFHGNPVLIGTAVLAYVLGLRHAVDADHVAAIDNAVRKLMQNGREPVLVGLYFSLGHSTVVALACGAITLGAVSLSSQFPGLRDLGSLIGTGVSAGFLLMIACVNIAVLVSVWRGRQGVRTAQSIPDAPLTGGILSRLLPPLMRIISRPEHMYPLGFLFGLGFDTATEVGLLGISASQASHAIPLWTIMVFPALFTAGMSLVDTSDGLLIAGAYGWALRHPIRRFAYNLAITLFSALVALIIGVLEALNLLAARLALTGAFWRWVANLNDHFGAVGCAIVFGLAACWAVFFVLCRWGSREPALASSGG